MTQTPQTSTLSYSEGAKLPTNAPQWAVAASLRLQQRRQNGETTISTIPPGVSKVLLHSCCAPCSGAMVEEMMAMVARPNDALYVSGQLKDQNQNKSDEQKGKGQNDQNESSSSYNQSNQSSLSPSSIPPSPQLPSQPNKLNSVTVFFYNPNIHPRKEYEIRKEENKRFCQQLNIPFIDADYDPENWYNRMKGMEYDPERGRRCTECFDMRMERTALYAHEHGFDAIATTNATSRWKDAKQVDESGYRAARKYEGLTYWCQDWQSDEMTLRKYEISAKEKFYKQEYCGCSYSLRDSNDWRKANGIPKIQIGGETAGLGERYFSDALVDAAEESQDVVDEFFEQAEEIARRSEGDVEKRREALRVYRERRKNEKDDGVINGLNNW